MAGSALVNAFKALRQKPMVLLLLFPFFAFTPLLLLFIPTMLNQNVDNSAAPYIMLAVMAGFLLAIFSMAARAILLVPPAMELLHDGAAGVKTPSVSPHRLIHTICDFLY